MKRIFLSDIEAHIAAVRERIAELDRSLKAELTALAAGDEKTGEVSEGVSLYHAYARAADLFAKQHHMGSRIGTLGQYQAIAESEAPAGLKLARFKILEERYAELLTLTRQVRNAERAPLPTAAAA